MGMRRRRNTVVKSPLFEFNKTKMIVEEKDDVTHKIWGVVSRSVVKLSTYDEKGVNYRVTIQYHEHKLNRPARKYLGLFLNKLRQKKTKLRQQKAHADARRPTRTDENKT